MAHTALIWDFVERHEPVLEANRRTRRAVGTLHRFDAVTREAICARAARAREELNGVADAELLRLGFD